jgi:hypothetical protein
MLAASVFSLAVASLPRAWLAYRPGFVGHVARMRVPLAVVGVAIPFGIAVGYLVVLLQLD